MKNIDARKIVTEERDRYAREIHDRAAQNLTAIGLNLQLSQSILEAKPEKAAQLIANCLELVTATSAELKATIFEPAALVKLGLNGFIKKYIADNKLQCSLQISGSEKSFSPAQELLAWRICSEILKHGKPVSEIVFDYSGKLTEISLKISNANPENHEYDNLIAKFTAVAAEQKLLISVTGSDNQTLVKLKL